MPRVAKPFVHQNCYVTEAGGKGVRKLCPVGDGVVRARQILKVWLEQCREERDAARRFGLVLTDTPYTVAQLAAELVKLKDATKKGATSVYYRKNLQRL